MDKRIYICAAVIFILALLVFLAYNYLEIYQENRYTPPSREVYSNRYYALERWLKETGHPVRIEKGLNPSRITNIPEKVAVIYASAFEWENAEEALLSWVKRGNTLIICLDYHNLYEIDHSLSKILFDLGVAIGETSAFGEYWNNNIPYFNWNIFFLVDTDTDIFIIKDNKDYIRLAELSLGEGKLVLSGYPIFMTNYNLGREINARLAWELTGERATGTGVLFVRTRYAARSFFGKIMERGNTVSVILSALIVIFLGFWMVIPVFGLVFEEKEKNSRPIKERFSAEANFLKKYRALDYYLEIYNRELPLTDNYEAAVSEENKDYNYKEIINKLRSVHDGTDKLKRRISGYKTGTGKE